VEPQLGTHLHEGDISLYKNGRLTQLGIELKMPSFLGGKVFSQF
jgi:hypothetical protein